MFEQKMLRMMIFNVLNSTGTVRCFKKNKIFKNEYEAEFYLNFKKHVFFAYQSCFFPILYFSILDFSL